MQKLNKVGFWVCAVFVAIAVVMLLADILTPKVSLAFDPAVGTYKKGDKFTVKVVLDTKGKKVDGVGLNIDFDKEKLKVLSAKVSADFGEALNSNFNNEQGIIEIDAVRKLESASFTGKGEVLEIVLEAKAAGRASLAFNKQTVALESGSAKELAKSVKNANYIIK